MERGCKGAEVLGEDCYGKNHLANVNTFIEIPIPDAIKWL